MNTYTVTCFCGWNQKSKVRVVDADSVMGARLSHKAVSHKMMANGWYVLKVESADGVVLYEGVKESA